jgi:hypothetical protein
MVLDAQSMNQDVLYANNGNTTMKCLEMKNE